MTITEKTQFVNDLIGSIQADILGNIHRTPENWNGFELRQWITDKFAEGCDASMSKQAKRDYRNDVTTLNL
jgi:hypothetical protein